MFAACSGQQHGIGSPGERAIGRVCHPDQGNFFLRHVEQLEGFHTLAGLRHRHHQRLRG
jgi:hypothetical protein